MIAPTAHIGASAIEREATTVESPDMSYERELAVVTALCVEADAIALEHHRVGVQTETKADGTPVTIADRAIETLVREGLARAFPADEILGEEQGSTGSGARRWIIDPIDGTKNYARGIPVFASLIALEDEDRLALGMVSAPALMTRWWATAGGGAFCNGAPMRVSDRATVEGSDIITGGVDWARERTDQLLALFASGRRHRGFGDFWGHMLVAQGSAEVMVEFAPLALWDIAAPKIIVEEAGGRVSDLSGDGSLKAGPVVTTNGVVHDEVLQLLARA
jgi:histidinol-phosphatase